MGRPETGPAHAGIGKLAGAVAAILLIVVAVAGIRALSGRRDATESKGPSASVQSEPVPVLPAPDPAAPPPAAAAAPDPGLPPNDVPLDEARFMAHLRSIEDGNPAAALRLAREGNLRFSGSPDSAERAMIVVKSLARTGALSEARAEAEAMVNAYPNTRWAREVEQRTGAHPHVDH